jgi:hypothetical protein
MICTTSLFYVLALTCKETRHDNPALRSRNHTLYDIPPIRFVFKVTQKDLRCSLMMAGYYRNIFFQCHHMSLMDFVVSPPGCGRSVTDF